MRAFVHLNELLEFHRLVRRFCVFFSLSLIAVVIEMIIQNEGCRILRDFQFVL